MRKTLGLIVFLAVCGMFFPQAKAETAIGYPFYAETDYSVRTAKGFTAKKLTVPSEAFLHRVNAVLGRHFASKQEFDDFVRDTKKVSAVPCNWEHGQADIDYWSGNPRAPKFGSYYRGCYEGEMVLQDNETGKIFLSLSCGNTILDPRVKQPVTTAKETESWFIPCDPTDENQVIYFGGPRIDFGMGGFWGNGMGYGYGSSETPIQIHRSRCR